MRVRMKADVSGTRDGADWPRRGTEIDLPDGEAADLCAAGLAEPVPDTGVETAADDRPAEKRRRGRPPKSAPEPSPEPSAEPSSEDAAPEGE